MKRLNSKWYLIGGVAFIVVVFAGPLLWFGALLAWPSIANYITVQGYQQGHCTILSKGLHYYTSYNQSNGSNDAQYAPDFTFIVQDTSHRISRGAGYSIDPRLFNESDRAQAILDQYHVGTVYPCWYDPANSSHAVLNREVTEWILLLPGGIMLLIGLVIPIVAVIILRRILRGWKQSNLFQPMLIARKGKML